jgi:hypothetical protein
MAARLPGSRRLEQRPRKVEIAFHFAQELKKAGFAVVGPAPSAARALALIEREGCNFAALEAKGPPSKSSSNC